MIILSSQIHKYLSWSQSVCLPLTCPLVCDRSVTSPSSRSAFFSASATHRGRYSHTRMPPTACRPRPHRVRRGVAALTPCCRQHSSPCCVTSTTSSTSCPYLTASSSTAPTSRTTRTTTAWWTSTSARPSSSSPRLSSPTSSPSTRFHGNRPCRTNR